MSYRDVQCYDPRQVITRDEAKTVAGLMLDAVVSGDNGVRGVPSRPGAVMATPSVPADALDDGDHLHHWVRDGAVAMLEVLALFRQDQKGRHRRILEDHVAFTSAVQAQCRDEHTPDDARPPLGLARWTLDGRPTPAAVQHDGPALRALLGLRLLRLQEKTLDKELQAAIDQALHRDVAYLCHVHDQPCRDPWDQSTGFHFFPTLLSYAALKDFADHHEHNRADEHCGKKKIAAALETLETRLHAHWDEGHGLWVSQLDGAGQPGHQVNMGGVLALLLADLPDGPFALTSERALATVRAPMAAFTGYGPFLGVNAFDERRGRGPNLGRYPFDATDPTGTAGQGHPWFLATNAMAAACYRLAHAARQRTAVAERTAAMFGLDPAAADHGLLALGHRFILATKAHWDHGRMSACYDGRTGVMIGVNHYTWSYASFLMAARAYARVAG